MIGEILYGIYASHQEQRRQFELQRNIGITNLKKLLGEKCEYCRSFHAKKFCPNCGAPRDRQIMK